MARDVDRPPEALLASCWSLPMVWVGASPRCAWRRPAGEDWRALASRPEAAGEALGAGLLPYEPWPGASAATECNRGAPLETEPEARRGQ